MRLVTIRKKKVKYVVLFLAFYLALCGISMGIYLPELFVFTIWMVFLSLCLLFYYYSIAPTIRLDEEVIKSGRKIFLWKDLENLNFEASKKGLLGIPVDGTSFTFKNQKRIFMRDHLYSNSQEIKMFVDRVIIKKLEYIPSTNSNQNNVSETVVEWDSYELFQSDQIPPYVTIRLGLIGMFFMLIFNGNLSVGKLFGAACILYVIVLLYRRIQFLVSSNFLLVKMKFNPYWEKVVFTLRDINQVDFEQVGSTYYIKITDLNFQNKRFAAANFSYNKILALQSKLKMYNVRIVSNF